MNEWLLILGMAIVTFVPRYLPLLFASRLNLPAPVEKALAYVPIAVLTIIIVQTALVHKGDLNMSFTNPYLGATLVAFLAALLQKRLFVTVAVGLISYIALRLWLL